MISEATLVLGSARGSRAGDSESIRESRTFLYAAAFAGMNRLRSSFRRAAETSTRAACAPQIAAQRRIL